MHCFFFFYFQKACQEGLQGLWLGLECETGLGLGVGDVKKQQKTITQARGVYFYMGTSQQAHMKLRGPKKDHIHEPG